MHPLSLADLSTHSPEPSTLLGTVTTTASAQASAQASALTTAPQIPPTSWLGLLGHALLAMAKGLPGMLIWIITFSTITLPTVLFALFSTSLTFTMNFTTLYV